jgi:hypothetical protein
MKTHTIKTFRKRDENKWFAEIPGKPQSRISGKTQVEAVGRLVIAKHRLLNIHISRDESKDL